MSMCLTSTRPLREQVINNTRVRNLFRRQREPFPRFTEIEQLVRSLLNIHSSPEVVHITISEHFINCRQR